MENHLHPVLSARWSARFGIKVTVGAGMLMAAIGLAYLGLVADVGTQYLALLPLALFPLLSPRRRRHPLQRQRQLHPGVPCLGDSASGS